jgi:hypothetical protein
MPGISVFTPITALTQAAKTVPAVRYAVGLVGIAGAITLIRGFLPDVGVVAMLPVLVGAILAMTVLVILAAAVASPARTPVANAFLWAVCVFVITFMLFTVTAVAINWPSAWADLILPSRAASVSLAAAASGNSRSKPQPVAAGSKVANEAEIRPSLPSTETHPAPAPVSYDKPNGTIAKAGSRWIEQDSTSSVRFTFQEVDRADGVTTVYDKSRNIYMQWPTKGGMVQWSGTNPIVWTNLYMVEPTSSN